MDFKYVQENSDGSKLKERYRDKQTGLTYEKYGHCSDTFEYFICEYFKKEYADFQGKKQLKVVPV